MHSRCQRRSRARRTNHGRIRRLVLLALRNCNVALRGRIFLDRAIARVADNRDHFIGSACIGTTLPSRHCLSHRAAIWKENLRRRLAQDDLQSGSLRLIPLKIAPGQNGNVHGQKVIGRDCVHVDVSVPATRWSVKISVPLFASLGWYGGKAPLATPGCRFSTSPNCWYQRTSVSPSSDCLSISKFTLTIPFGSK